MIPESNNGGRRGAHTEVSPFLEQKLNTFATNVSSLRPAERSQAYSVMYVFGLDSGINFIREVVTNYIVSTRADTQTRLDQVSTARRESVRGWISILSAWFAILSAAAALLLQYRIVPGLSRI